MGFIWVQLACAVNLAPEPTDTFCAVPSMIPSVTPIGPGNVVIFDTIARPLIAMAATRVIELQQ